MNLRPTGKDDNLKNYETQIISYLLRKEKYIKELFSQRNLEGILNLFHNSDTRKVSEYILGYYTKYKEVIVEREFKSLIGNSLSNDEITEGEYKQYGSVFQQAKEFFTKLDDAQFNRVYDEWVEAEISVQLKLFIEKNSILINSNRGMEFIDVSIKEFRKFQHVISGEEDYVRILDIAKDKATIKADIQNRKDNPDQYKGTPTYYPTLDRHFGGFEKKTLTLLGGLSGSGKSTLALNIAHNIYQKGNKKILYISLEMPFEQCIRKMNSRESHIEYEKLKNPESLTEEEETQLYKVIDDREGEGGTFKILDLPASTYTWDEIMFHMKDQIPEYEPDMIFIDHLGLVALPSTGERRDVLLGQMTKDIRSYAKKKDIAIVAMVQANRASKTRNKKTNKYEVNIELENIEDSNKMGQDCDNFLAVIMEKKDDIAVCLFVDIKKQRDGEKDVRVPFETDLSRCMIFDKGSLLEEDEDSWLSSEKDVLEEFENQEDDLLSEIAGLEDKVGEDFKTEEDEESVEEIVTEHQELDDIIDSLVPGEPTAVLNIESEENELNLESISSHDADDGSTLDKENSIIDYSDDTTQTSLDGGYGDIDDDDLSF